MRSLHACLAPRGLGLLAAVVLGLLLPVIAAAHPVAPALLKLTESADGRVAVDWKQPPRRGGRLLQPRLPERCAVVEEPEKRRLDGELVESWTLDCGAEGLAGAEVTVDGLDLRRGEVMVFAALAEGSASRAILRADQPSWIVPREQGPLAVFGDYLILGVEHILLGPDHLLFVLALVLLVPQLRRLVWTVTGFTAGHSITLALAALGLVHVPSAPVEILIAASILLLAVELTRDQDDLVHRRPWLVAGGFGLLHGLGFAGALAEIGLPEGEIPLALLAFNLGIEAGQLLFVAAVLAIGWALRPWIPRMPRWLRWSPVYAIGGLSVFWILERSAGLL